MQLASQLPLAASQQLGMTEQIAPTHGSQLPSSATPRAQGLCTHVVPPAGSPSPLVLAAVPPTHKVPSEPTGPLATPPLQQVGSAAQTAVTHAVQPSCNGGPVWQTE